MNYISSEMIRGHLDTIILLTLTSSDKSSNQIKELVESRSGGQYIIKQGTFYSCLQRIVKQGFVTEYRTTDPEGVRRKFFKLTDKGKAYVDENIDSWSFSKQIIDLLISPDDDVSFAVSSQTDDKKERSNLSAVPKNKPNNVPSANQSSDENSSENAASEKNESDDDALATNNDVKYSYNVVDIEALDNRSTYSEAQNEYSQERTRSFFAAENSAVADSEHEKHERSSVIEEPRIEKIDKNEIKADDALSLKTSQESVATHKDFSASNDRLSEVDYSDDANPADTNVDYRSVLEGIFPSKSSSKSSTREITYNDGVDVDEFFGEDRKKSYAKSENQKASKTIESDIDDDKELKRATPTENKKTSKTKPFYDFTNIQNMADEEGFKIRISSSDNKKDVGRILINKLNLFSSLIIFGILAIEALLLFIVTGSVAELDFIPYLIFILICALFPATNAVIYLLNPNRKIRQITSFKNSIELIVIICLNLLLIDVVCCILGAMDFSSYKELLRYLIYPLIFILTIPFYVVIRYSLLNKNKFFE